MTASIRNYATRARLIDLPNSRSSHSNPTPRGGGLGIVIAMTLGEIVLWCQNSIDLNFGIAVICGLAVAIVGFMDDRESLSVSVRMSVHLVTALCVMNIFGGLASLQIGERYLDLGVYGYILGILAIVWSLNLFNFMDGIDGIAASEAIFVAFGGAWLAYLTGTSHAVSLVALLLATSCLGFLVLNWPPAKIFMGDVGSGYLGYMIAVLAIAAARDNPAALFVWLTLGGVFFVDATTTIVRRLVRGERIYEAHRSHAYQWLSRRWQSHLRVTLVVWAINLMWLLPMAWCCIHFPANAWWISLVALAPLMAGAYVVGAGRPELPTTCELGCMTRRRKFENS